MNVLRHVWVGGFLFVLAVSVSNDALAQRFRCFRPGIDPNRACFYAATNPANYALVRYVPCRSPCWDRYARAHGFNDVGIGIWQFPCRTSSGRVITFTHRCLTGRDGAVYTCVRDRRYYYYGPE
jgi:hypothetical protein